MRMRGWKMKIFSTRAHMKTNRDFSWIYGCRQGTKGLKEIKIGFQWHYWPARETRWFIWDEKHAPEWIRERENWSLTS